MDHFHYKNNELMAEDVPLRKIALELGTPAYVYSKATFVRHLDVLKAAFDGHEHIICYSVKTAGNLALLREVAGRGCGADVVSGGELFRALKAGIRPDKIVFSGVGKKASEMAEALKAGILMFNVESEAEMVRLGEVSAQAGLVAPMSFRINPAVDPKTHPYIATGLQESKFGVPHGEALALYAKAGQNPHLKVIGLDCHIGSQLTEVEPFVEAASRLRELLMDLRAAGHVIKYFDMGGGLGITYDDEKPPAPGAYAQALDGVTRDLGVTVILEPGRVVAGNAAVLLVETLYNKKTPDREFVIVDGAMNDLVRPSLYGAHHEILPVIKREGFLTRVVDVVGPVCESTDFLAKARELPVVEAGDFLAVKSAGAYGFSMSSNYNARPRAAEVLVDGDRFTVIRRRETYDDLVAPEIAYSGGR